MGRRTPKSVKASCDKLFSKIIRSQGFCTRCGSEDKSKLHCAHIYSRKYNSVRFDKDNAVCLCAKCHRWAHDNPPEYTKWLDTFKDLDALEQKKETLGRYKLHQFLEIEERLKEKIVQLDR